MDSLNRSNSIQQELIALNQHGQFIASVLTGTDGLPIAGATSSNRQLAEILAAVAPLVQRMVQRSNARVGLSAANEVVVNNSDGSRLVCRFFEARQQTLILACVVPHRSPFRRAMNRAVRGVQMIWVD